jgi:hypothetical protein
VASPHSTRWSPRSTRLDVDGRFIGNRRHLVGVAEDGPLDAVLFPELRQQGREGVVGR